MNLFKVTKLRRLRPFTLVKIINPFNYLVELNHRNYRNIVTLLRHTRNNNTISFTVNRKEKNSLGLMEYNKKERERIELNRITIRTLEVEAIKSRI